jgi:hypothetical protein
MTRWPSHGGSSAHDDPVVARFVQLSFHHGAGSAGCRFANAFDREAHAWILLERSLDGVSEAVIAVAAEKLDCQSPAYGRRDYVRL